MEVNYHEKREESNDIKLKQKNKSCGSEFTDIDQQESTTVSKETLYDSLTNVLTSYNAQTDEYERSLATFSVSYISIVITVMIGAITLALDKNSINRYVPYILLVVGLLFPAFITLFLFIFSHYTRWIAFYRGYCSYLEKQLNMLSGGASYFFHNKIRGNGMKGLSASQPLYYGLLIFLDLISVAMIVMGLRQAEIDKAWYWIIIFFNLIEFVVTGIGDMQFFKSIDDNGKMTAEFMTPGEET